jgi:pimeloyl-ACP methyl ester carboxylesterase
MEHSTIGTILFRWQTPVPFEVLTDLMWLRRNRLMGLKLARRILQFRRSHPRTALHLIAFSGGAAIAVFACERLRGRGRLETLALICPAMSPDYNLAPALRSVTRCYALISQRDRLILGIGTRLFGTTDRKFSAGAGKVGFRIPAGAASEEIRTYDRLRLIRWTPSLKALDHHGGHMGWGQVPLLRRHLPALLRGEPKLAVEEVRPP